MMPHILQRMARMRKEEFILTTPDGYQLATAVYMPDGEQKGYLHILHGMSEYHGRYDDFARYIASNGYVVGLHSHRGHGKNAELNHTPLGYYGPTDGFNKVVEDVHFVMMTLRTRYDLPKPILLGHSMGSIVTRRFIELYSDTIQKVIIMGTLVHSPIHQVAAQLAKRLAKRDGEATEAKLIDRLGGSSNNRKIKNAETPKDWLSTDRAQVAAYLKDPYCNYTSTNQFYADFMEGFEVASRPTEVAKIRKDLPMLLISGSDDPIGGYGKGVWKVARQYYDAGISKLSVHLFDGMRHEILNETNNQLIYQTILKWLEKKIYEQQL